MVVTPAMVRSSENGGLPSERSNNEKVIKSGPDMLVKFISQSNNTLEPRASTIAIASTTPVIPSISSIEASPSTSVTGIGFLIPIV